MPITPVAEVLVLDALLEVPRWVSLHTGDPSMGNEVAGGSYARQPITFDASGGDPTIYTNDTVIQFPAATAAWGLVSWFGIYDAVSGGNLMAYETVDIPRDIIISDIVRWEVGQLVVQAD